MKLRLGAAVLAVALTTLTTAAASAPAHAGTGTDTTPPEVGSCHDLTYDEAYEPYDPDAAVACEERHTSITTKVIVFDTAPDWSDLDAINKKVTPACLRAELAFFDGKAKPLQMSTYTTWIFYPTRVQQEAGATWVRCDVALYGYKSLKPLPTTGAPTLHRPPLPDGVTECRKGKSADFAFLSCDKAHQYRATAAFKHPGGSYPGLKKMIKWTINRCGRAIGGPFYYEAATKFDWRLGFRYSVCLAKTRG